MEHLKIQDTERQFDLVKWSPDGKRLAVTDVFEMLSIYTLGDHIEELRIPEHRELEVTSVDWSPDSTHIVCVSPDHPEVTILDALTGNVTLVFDCEGGGSWHARYSPDGKRIAIACNSQRQTREGYLSDLGFPAVSEPRTARFWESSPRSLRRCFQN